MEVIELRRIWWLSCLYNGLVSMKLGECLGSLRLSSVMGFNDKKVGFHIEERGACLSNPFLRYSCDGFRYETGKELGLCIFEYISISVDSWSGIERDIFVSVAVDVLFLSDNGSTLTCHPRFS